jgi:phosphoglycerate dehydrogenase-like enzyme
MSDIPIHIALVGNFALQGRERLEAALRVPYTLTATPESASLAEMLADIAPAEVIVTKDFTREMAARTPKLRLVHAIGAGVDAIDQSALGPGVKLCNVFHHGVGIAEYVVMAMLLLPRRILTYDRDLRRGGWGRSNWTNQPAPDPFPELRGKTLAILGLGTIGRELAPRAKAFGMRVLAMRRSGPGGAPVPGVDGIHGPDGLEALLRAADYVAVTLPLAPETRGLIGARELGWMKPGAYIVNVARGPIIEEEALYEALKARRLGGLASDVWYVYPRAPFGDDPVMPSRLPFHELDNVLMTPHISGLTEGTFDGRFGAIAENINRLVRGESLENQLVPPPGAP